MVLEAIFEKGDKIGWIWPFVNIVLNLNPTMYILDLELIKVNIFARDWLEPTNLEL